MDTFDKYMKAPDEIPETWPNPTLDKVLGKLGQYVHLKWKLTAAIVGLAVTTEVFGGGSIREFAAVGSIFSAQMLFKLRAEKAKLAQELIYYRRTADLPEQRQYNDFKLDSIPENIASSSLPVTAGFSVVVARMCIEHPDPSYVVAFSILGAMAAASMTVDSALQNAAIRHFEPSAHVPGA